MGYYIVLIPIFRREIEAERERVGSHEGPFGRMYTELEERFQGNIRFLHRLEMLVQYPYLYDYATDYFRCELLMGISIEVEVDDKEDRDFLLLFKTRWETNLGRRLDLAYLEFFDRSGEE